MFVSVRYRGVIVNAVRKPLRDVPLLLRVLPVDNPQWEPVSEVVTDAKGAFDQTFQTRLFIDTQFTPQFQLVFAGQRGVRPVGVAPTPTVTGRTLALDFGTIVPGGAGPDEPDDGLDPAVTAEVTRLKTHLLESQLELADVHARLEVASATSGRLEAERDDLQLQLEQIRNAEASSPLISDLTRRVATSLGDVASGDAPGGFRLGEARVTLKGYLAEGGNRFKPLDAAEVVSATAPAASEITFNLQPADTAGSAANTMPDLTGVTPSTARGILRPLGPTVQVIEVPGTPVGAVIKQHPEPGAELARGATVRLEVASGSSEE